jgi:hypothetical protein
LTLLLLLLYRTAWVLAWLKVHASSCNADTAGPPAMPAMQINHVDWLDTSTPFTVSCCMGMHRTPSRGVVTVQPA